METGATNPSPGDKYRCMNVQCECEIALVQMPRPGSGRSTLPACCYCGTPMQRIADL
jgi:hypothetical protein